MENVLEIKNLRKEYKGFTLKDISFSIPKGYICGLIGPNGAGKTTIIKAIMNLIKKDGGEIHVFGMDNIKHEVEIKSRIGFSYDTPGFYEDIPISLMAKIIAPFYKDWDQERFEHLMKAFELPPKKWFKRLSQGMKMKFSLAIALSHNADFIILDEPTSGLDPIFRRELLDMLADLMQDENKSVLFSTHITSDLERIADYITFLNDGELVFSETKDEVMENWGIVKGGENILNPELSSLFNGYRKSSVGVEALTNDIKQAQKRLNSDVIIEKASLEDIMFFIKKGGHNV